ncbi:thiamine phosphate synthase [Advenella sp. RU8]|uniref:thiamine phosphate synthase n=1 Tax=Advenella sp. RU8 TaxID=3399575 RepID=UPI003AACB391
MTEQLRFPRGLYGITPAWDDIEKLYKAIEQACEGGMNVLQWRRKNTPFEIALKQAARVADICKQHNTLFFINDDWELALAINADGVHLGREDAAPEFVRQQAASHNRQAPLLIGVSCYNQLDKAQQAIAQDLDYVAFGALFDSRVKPEAEKASLDLFPAARQLLPNRSPRPALVGIGGIDIHNAKSVIQAGADSISVISGLFEQADIRNTAKALSNLFEN